MISIKIKIDGVTPLLVHAFTDEAQMSATSGARVATSGDRGTPHEQAAASLYLNEDGQPIIPQPNLFRCILDAGKFFKAGKSKVTTIKSSLIPACLSIDALAIPILHEEDWTVDQRPVRIPSTGGRIIRYRPCFHDWALAFTAELDTDIISANLFREIVDAAGKRIGLGDFRPDCKGPFGKFVVTEWTIEDAAKKAA